MNKDFGSIFSSLLPGSNAKLEPVGDSVLEGLEIKVAFGDVWKESLTELSGGQRYIGYIGSVHSCVLTSHQVACCIIPNPVTLALQAGTAVHP